MSKKCDWNNLSVDERKRQFIENISERTHTDFTLHDHHHHLEAQIDLDIDSIIQDAIKVCSDEGATPEKIASEADTTYEFVQAVAEVVGAVIISDYRKWLVARLKEVAMEGVLKDLAGMLGKPDTVDAGEEDIERIIKERRNPRERGH